MNSFYRDNKLYLVTELMQDNLNNIIRTQRLKSDDIRYIIYQILNGLNYLHNCGIVHGDLKPSDIGLNKDFSIKIIDLNVEQPKESDYVLTKWFVNSKGKGCHFNSNRTFSGIEHRKFCSHGSLPLQRWICGAWDASWLSFFVVASSLPDVIVGLAIACNK